MKKSIEKHVRSCEKCQKYKKTARRKYGHLPVRDDNSPDPFHTVAVDLVGPWKILVEQALGDGQTREQTISFQALTIIDEGTALLEIEPYHSATSLEIATLFDLEWLCRYPRPVRVRYDNGSEFLGQEFQEMLTSYGIKRQPTTVKNPQANAILERVHLTMGDQLRMASFSYETWQQDVRAVCKATAWALRSTIHSTINYSPGQLAFGRDMIMQNRITADWERIKEKRMRAAVKSNARENSTRVAHTYEIGQLVLIVRNDKDVTRKLRQPTEGPYEILRVYRNGTVKIRRGNYDEILSIRRIRPFIRAD